MKVLTDWVEGLASEVEGRSVLSVRFSASPEAGLELHAPD